MRRSIWEALLAPVALPAGGADLVPPQICRLEESRNHFAGENCVLRVTPLEDSPKLHSLKLGTPVRILRFWSSSNGHSWIQIEIASIEALQVVGLPRRGWIHGRTT